MPTVGIGTAPYAAWRLEQNSVPAEADFSDSRIGRAWLWLVRILVPATILGIFLQSTGAL